MEVVMGATEKKRMLNALFPGRDGEADVTNVKFFLGDDRNISEEDLCREFSQALEQERIGVAKRSTTVDGSLERVTIDRFLTQ
jgi:hypothetical protein